MISVNQQLPLSKAKHLRCDPSELKAIRCNMSKEKLHRILPFSLIGPVRKLRLNQGKWHKRRRTEKVYKSTKRVRLENLIPIELFQSDNTAFDNKLKIDLAHVNARSIKNKESLLMK